MPKMGISVVEGTLVEWRKQPGDELRADEPVADVTTDKVDVEIPAPCAGTLARLLCEPGETVSVGTPIAEIAVGAASAVEAAAQPTAANGPAETVFTRTPHFRPASNASSRVSLSRAALALDMPPP